MERSIAEGQFSNRRPAWLTAAAGRSRAGDRRWTAAIGLAIAGLILLIYLACFAPLAMSARAGVRSVAQEQVHAAYSMGASKWQVIRHVIVPAAMPEILTAMRIAIGFGWTTLVAAEMVAATKGLGQMVLNASNFLRTDIVIMGIVVIGAVAYLFDLLMRYVERLVVPWKGKV